MRRLISRLAGLLKLARDRKRIATPSGATAAAKR